MTRAWIIFSTLTLGVLFKLWRDDYPQKMYFIFTDVSIPIQWGIYFLIEHINAIAIALCLLIKDDTPKFLLGFYCGILIVDGLYFVGFYRDEGIGFNAFKVITYALALLYFQIKRNVSPAN